MIAKKAPRTGVKAKGPQSVVAFERVTDADAPPEVPVVPRQPTPAKGPTPPPPRVPTAVTQSTPERRAEPRRPLDLGARPPGTRRSAAHIRPVPASSVALPPVIEPLEIPQPGSLGDGALKDFHDAEILLLASIVVLFAKEELTSTAKRLYQEVLYQMQRRSIDFTAWSARLAERANLALQGAHDADLLREVARVKAAVRKGRG